MHTLLLLLPDLALIATGAALARGMRWSPGFWAHLEKLVYYVLFPPLLFTAIVRHRIDAAQAAPFALGVFGVLLVGIALGALGRRLFDVEARRFSSAVQCAFRFNSYVALAVSQRLGGDAGVALCAVMVAVAVPTGNLAAVWFMARGSSAGVLRSLARNPLVIATVCGVIALLLDLRLPEVLSAYLSRLGAAAIALGLIAVGAGLEPSGARGDDGFARYAIAVKLLAMPLAAWMLAQALNLPPLATPVLVLFGAVPSASSCYVLATNMGGDGPYVARLVTATTVLSAASLPLWLAWVS